MDIDIRSATEIDLPDLVRLNDEIQHQHVTLYPDDFRHPTDPARVATFFARLLESDADQVMLATSGEEAVGYLWYEMQGSRGGPLKPPRRRLYVHHVHVAASHRRQGIAGRLMDHVEEVARSRQRDLAEVVLDTWAANEGALAFFGARGYETFRLVQRKRIVSCA